MEKFAGYAFNKSHSATYALVAYQTAWLKANYPAQFMAATLSADMQNIDKVATLIDEVRRMELPMQPPNVNRGEFRFSVIDGGMVYGLGAVRGVGEAPVQAIVAARASGRFKDLAEFCVRVDAKKANRRVVEALIKCGALDDFALADEPVGAVRARLWSELDQALQGADQAARDVQSGMGDLFGGVAAGAVRTPAKAAVTPMSLSERLAGEKETLGLYLSGHPIEPYLAELPQFCNRVNELRAGRAKQVVGGTVVSVRTVRGRKGDTIGFAVIEDQSGRMEVSLFAEIYERDRNKLEKDQLVIIEGEVQKDDYNDGLKVRAERVMSIEEARSRFSQGLRIHLCEDSAPADLANRLTAVLAPFVSPNGGCPVSVIYRMDSAEGCIELSPEWRVRASDQLLEQLQAEFGADQVGFVYPG